MRRGASLKLLPWWGCAVPGSCQHLSLSQHVFAARSSQTHVRSTHALLVCAQVSSSFSSSWMGAASFFCKEAALQSAQASAGRSLEEATALRHQVATMQAQLEAAREEANTQVLASHAQLDAARDEVAGLSTQVLALTAQLRQMETLTGTLSGQLAAATRAAVYVRKTKEISSADMQSLLHALQSLDPAPTLARLGLTPLDTPFYRGAPGCFFWLPGLCLAAYPDQNGKTIVGYATNKRLPSAAVLEAWTY